MNARRFAALGVVAAALVAAAPAQAINDPRVPANECSNFHSVAVGDPLAPGNPGINLHTPQPGTPSNGDVSPFVSGNNPGVSTGARAVLNPNDPSQGNSNAIGTCPNSLDS